MKLRGKILGVSAALLVPGALVAAGLLFVFPSLRAWLMLNLTKLGISLGIVSTDTDGDDADTFDASAPSASPDAPALAAQLGSALPATFAPILLPLANAVLGNVPDTGSLTPKQYGLLGAALAQRESGGKAGSTSAPGAALGGSTGLQGDQGGSRWRYGPPKWTTLFPGSLTGSTKPGTKGTLYEVTAPAAFGGDAGYWAFSKVQLDFESWYSDSDFQTNWQDDNWALNAGLYQLSKSIDSLGSVHDGVASYNCGVGAARTARAAGIDPDTKTTGGNYAADIIARANAWGAGIPTDDSGDANV